MNGTKTSNTRKLSNTVKDTPPKIVVDEEIYKRIKTKYNEMPEKSKEELVSSMSWFFLTDEIIKKTRLQIQAKMKVRDIISLFLAAIGVLTNILASYNYINFEKVQESDGK